MSTFTTSHQWGENSSAPTRFVGTGIQFVHRFTSWNQQASLYYKVSAVPGFGLRSEQAVFNTMGGIEFGKKWGMFVGVGNNLLIEGPTNKVRAIPTFELGFSATQFFRFALTGSQYGIGLSAGVGYFF
ncbi:MAG: hypothetical protein H6765_06385 [Candidatus Peribacteria bacterium]|nr:MAG: hypothetical protein H6765_06385 [Candidatus Peribacteria bacterium]